MNKLSIEDLVYKITGNYDFSSYDIEYFNNLYLQIQPIMFFHDSVSNNRSKIEESSQVIQKYLRIMNEINWPPILSMPCDITNEIVNDYEMLTFDVFEQRLNERISVFYHENFETRIITHWKSIKHFQNRIHILEQMIKGHLAGYYFLTIPVAFSQIEGILAEINNHKGRLNTKDIKKYFNDLLKNDSWDLTFKIILNELSYQNINWGDSIPQFSRHSIMHGADIKYGNESNSLKAIAHIDYLSHITI